MVCQIGLTTPIDIEKAEIAYLFEEGKGKVAKDASNNKRNGSLESGVKYGPGKFGTGLVYDGKDDNLIVKGYHGIGGQDPRTEKKGKAKKEKGRTKTQNKTGL